MSKNRSEVFAPKGLLKMLILKIASTKPVTGVEIMQDVPGMTENLWSPSPGSVYYLLGEMEEGGLIIRVPTGEPGIKRYVSSEKGKLSSGYFQTGSKKEPPQTIGDAKSSFGPRGKQFGFRFDLYHCKKNCYPVAMPKSRLRP